MGGTIAGGTYFLTDFAYHGGTPTTNMTCDSSTISVVLEVTALSDSAGTMRSTELQGPGGSPYSRGWTYQTNGTTAYTYTSTCGLSGTFSLSYTATPNQYLYFSPGDTLCWDDTTIVWTYTKQ